MHSYAVQRARKADRMTDSHKQGEIWEGNQLQGLQYNFSGEITFQFGCAVTQT